MNVYRNYDQTIKNWSTQITPWHALVYCVTICKRSAPLYYKFVDQNDWGKKEALQDSHNLLTHAIAGEVISSTNLENCIQRLEYHTPDTEMLSDVSCTYATDTGLIHIYATELIKKHNPDNVYYIARYCYEIVDAAVFEEIMPDGGIVTDEIEQKAEQHKFILEEIEWQAIIRNDLQALRHGDFNTAKAKIAEWSQTPIVN